MLAFTFVRGERVAQFHPRISGQKVLAEFKSDFPDEGVDLNVAFPEWKVERILGYASGYNRFMERVYLYPAFGYQSGLSPFDVHRLADLIRFKRENADIIIYCVCDSLGHIEWKRNGWAEPPEGQIECCRLNMTKAHIDF